MELKSHPTEPPVTQMFDSRHFRYCRVWGRLHR